jgi:hypothetical protein
MRITDDFLFTYAAALIVNGAPDTAPSMARHGVLAIAIDTGSGRRDRRQGVEELGIRLRVDADALPRCPCA